MKTNSVPTTNIFEWRDGDSEEMAFLADLAESCGAQFEWHTPCREVSPKMPLILGATVSFDAANASDIECGALLIITHLHGFDLNSPIAHLRVDQVEDNTIWATVTEVFNE